MSDEKESNDSVKVVTDDSKSKKRIKDLETENATLEDHLKTITGERDELQKLVKKASDTPAPSGTKSIWDELTEWFGI